MGFLSHITPNFDAAQKDLAVPPGQAVVTSAFTHLPLFTKVSRSMTSANHLELSWHLGQWGYEYSKYLFI